MTPPTCRGCRLPLMRLRHAYVEHLVLDAAVYRELNAYEGTAGETILACDLCGTELDQVARRFFYEHWAVIEQLRTQDIVKRSERLQREVTE